MPDAFEIDKETGDIIPIDFKTFSPTMTKKLIYMNMFCPMRVYFYLKELKELNEKWVEKNLLEK